MFVHTATVFPVFRPIRKSVRDGSIFAIKHKVLRVDGTQGWTFSRAIPVRDETGAIKEWFGAASDITESKKQSEALRISEESLRIAADVVRLGYTRLDLASSKYTTAMRCSSRIMGERPVAPSRMESYWQAFTRMTCLESRPPSNPRFAKTRCIAQNIGSTGQTVLCTGC